MNRTFVSLATAALLATTTASAQGTGQGPVAHACASEINQYCAHLSHGAGAVRSCLHSHRKSLSHDCRQALDHTGYGKGWR